MNSIVGTSPFFPPTTPDQHPHIAAIYRGCSPGNPPHDQSSLSSDAIVPLKAGSRGITPRSRVPPVGRYPVFHLVYEGGARRIHKLFVETASEGAVRGLYLQVTGTAEAGMRYSEVPGDLPERALPGPLMRKTCVGTVSAPDLDEFRSICRRGHSQRPPPGPECRTCSWQPMCHSQDWAQQTIERGVATRILDNGK